MASRSSPEADALGAEEAPVSIAGAGRIRAPRIRRPGGDDVFRFALGACAAVSLALTAVIGLELLSSSREALRAFGPGFVVSTTWDPVAGVFGAAPFLYGTVVSSAIALLIAAPIGIGAALFLTEIVHKRWATPLRFLLELLAAIPSVVYGLWGIFVLVPLLQSYVEPFLADHFDFIPLFAGAPYGVGMLAGGLVLAIMVLPTIASVSIDVIRAVPRAWREGAYALGATRLEVILETVLPGARTGVTGALVLALGRALGETMAVTMVIGNRPEISASLLDPGHTMSAVLANEFAEASGSLYPSALAEIALLLFAMTFVVNAIARLMLPKPGSAGR